MVTASASGAEDPGFESRLCQDFSDQWLPCQVPGGIGSVLGLVGPVSVYCDCVRWKVWSATSISVYQHVKLSEQIRPWDTLSCCWDGKQPTNKQTLSFRSLSCVFLHHTISVAWWCAVHLKSGRSRDQSPLSLVESYLWLNTIRTADETFSFLACRRQRLQTRNFRSWPVPSFLCSGCWRRIP